MHACPACSGFVPRHLSACPHCDAPRAPTRFARLARAVAGLVAAGGALVTLAACYGLPPQIDTCVDEDGDGWLPGCYNDDLSCDDDDANCDCDDHDPTTNPGAIDPEGDGRDRDCDGKDGQRPGGPLPDAAQPAPDGWWQDDAGWPDAAISVDAAVDLDAVP